jgi:hypothetical protein
MKPPSIGVDFSNEYLAELRKQGLSSAEVNKKLSIDALAVGCRRLRREAVLAVASAAGPFSGVVHACFPAKSYAKSP